MSLGKKKIQMQGAAGITGTDHFTPKLYTGNSSTNAITGVGFQPDLVWIKCRTDSRTHSLLDSVRGASKIIQSESTAVEWDGSAYFDSFDSNGFTVKSNANFINNSSHDYVAWCWKAGGTAVSNTDGTITSSVSANQASGFSIVKYTGTGANASVGHGLSSAPELIFIKNLDSSTTSWNGWTPVSGVNNYISLNSSAGLQTTAGFSGFSNGAPTSSVINLDASSWSNQSGSDHIAYCFHSVDGYQKVGSYTGNTTTPPTVSLGFQPRWILIKKTATAASFNHWYILDTVRDTDGSLNKALMPSLTNAEATYTTDYVDISSNGFTPNGGFNTNGIEHIYLAIA